MTVMNITLIGTRARSEAKASLLFRTIAASEANSKNVVKTVKNPFSLKARSSAKAMTAQAIHQNDPTRTIQRRVNNSTIAAAYTPAEHAASSSTAKFIGASPAEARAPAW